MGRQKAWLPAPNPPNLGFPRPPAPPIPHPPYRQQVYYPTYEQPHYGDSETFAEAMGDVAHTMASAYFEKHPDKAVPFLWILAGVLVGGPVLLVFAVCFFLAIASAVLH